MEHKTGARLLELDVFRGIAAMAVVLYHYTTRYGELFGHPVTVYLDFPLGYYGVNLFFIISGFVIFLTLNRTESHWDFIVSRFSRLYPVYWAAVTVSFACMLVFGLEGLERTPWEYVANLSMISGFFDVRDIDGVYWTLRYELLFYFWMLVLFKLRTFKYIEYVGLAWVSIPVFAALLTKFDIGLPGFVQKYLILSYIHLFVAGIIFFNIRQSGVSLIRLLVLAVCLLSDFLQRELLGFLITASFFSAFYMFVRGWLASFAFQPLVYLGTISYSLYLIHENIGFIVMNELYAFGISQIPLLIVSIFVSICIAHVLTYAIEKPGLRWVRAKYKSIKHIKLSKA